MMMTIAVPRIAPTHRRLTFPGVGVCAVCHHVAAVHGVHGPLPIRCAMDSLTAQGGRHADVPACLRLPQLTGVASELAVIGFAIPYVRSRKLYLVEMPNAWNFAMGITAWVRLIAFGYIFGFPMVRAGGKACGHS